jgi:hypothetical protein
LIGIAFRPAAAEQDCARPGSVHRPGRIVMPWFCPLLNLDRSDHLSIARLGFRTPDHPGVRFIPVIVPSRSSRCRPANAIVIGRRGRSIGGGNNRRFHPINAMPQQAKPPSGVQPLERESPC